MRSRQVSFIIGLGLLLSCLAPAGAARAADLLVTSPADSGPGTLREALEISNSNGEPDTITFAGDMSISAASPFVITGESTTVDASGRNVTINSTGDFSCVYLYSADNTIRGLTINDVKVSGVTQASISIWSSGNTVAGCTIRATGADTSWTHDGVAVYMGDGNTIGGTSAGDGNVILGFPQGINFYPSCSGAATVAGNYIGTDRTCTIEDPSINTGVWVRGGTIAIGVPGSGNVITGVESDVALESGAGGSSLRGNFLGVRPDGTRLGSSYVSLRNCTPDTRIGGPGPGEGNCISGGGGAAVFCYDNGTGAIFQGNRIGVKTDGTPGPVNHQGLYVLCDGAVIGGEAPGEGNYICNNDAYGAFIGSSNNTVLGNTFGTPQAPNTSHIMFFGSAYTVTDNVVGGPGGAMNTFVGASDIGIDVAGAARGIRIGPNVFSGNRNVSHVAVPIDLRTGETKGSNVPQSDFPYPTAGAPNLNKHFPVLTAADLDEDRLLLAGTSDPADAVDLYFAQGEKGGYGQGRFHIATVACDDAGAFSWTGPPRVRSGLITATATDGQGNTSEFSANLPVVTHETPAPKGAILINDGAPSTTTSAVSLKLNASCKGASSGEIMMRLSNRADLAGSRWQPLKKSLPWKLAAGRGRRTVYVRYRGPGGALSPVYADSIDVRGSGLPTTYYLAEGYTAQGACAPDDVFDTWVLVQNPSGEDARLRATFMVNGSAGNVTREYVARAHSRLSIAVDEIPGLESTDVSTRVECLNGVGIAVERAMYFSYRGAVGSSGSIAVSEPSRTWYFGEGYTADGFDTWILVQNPGDEDALVEAAFVDEKGHVGRHAYPVPARTRYTIEVDRVPGFQSNYVATSLASNRPVVAERAMYFNYRGVTGGHNSVGSTAPAAAWYLPEGYVSRDPNWFDTYALLANPGEEDCEIKATYMRNFRDPVSERFTIPPHSRKTVLLNEVPGLESTDVSCLFASGNGVAFVAERSSYFDYYGIREGTNSLGSVAAHSDWYVPQGYQSDTWDTWILVENPNPCEAVCHVSFMTEAGKVVDGTYTVPAASRYTIGLGRVDAVLDSTGVSIAVHTARSTPVVVERATYSLYRGLKGGDTSIGIGVN